MWALAPHRHAERATQLLLIEEVSGLGEFQLRRWSDEQHGQQNERDKHQYQNPRCPSERLYAACHDKQIE
jgi:hypothetical protein